MTTRTYTTAVANSYPAKEWLKKAGFTFDSVIKQWVNYNFNEQEWQDKYCNPTYVGRGNAKLTQAVKFETKTSIED